jgi:hypothetical protein
MNPSAPVTKVVSAVPPVMSQFSDGTESQTTDTTRTRLVRRPHVHGLLHHIYTYRAADTSILVLSPEYFAAFHA